MSQERLIARKVRIAQGILERLRGLIGTPELKDDEGLLIPHCQGVHSFGMAYPIDLVFLDRRQTVIQIHSGFPPNAFGPICLKARSILEFPAGTIEKFRVQVGDKLCLTQNTD